MIKYFLAVVLSLHCACAYAESRPNVLWIYLEDVSGWLSCYGAVSYTHLTLPTKA